VRYFGPFQTSRAIERVLEQLEEQFGLRQLSFQVKFGENKDASRREYMERFEEAVRALPGLIEADAPNGQGGTAADLLFDSDTNESRDLVAVAAVAGEGGEAVGQVLQLRKGVLRNAFSYTVEAGRAARGEEGDGDFAEAMGAILEAHYGSVEDMPAEVLLMQGVDKGVAAEVRKTIKAKTGERCVLRVPRKSGPFAATDKKAMEFAVANAEAAANQAALGGAREEDREKRLAQAKSLQNFLQLPNLPERIECYDVRCV
jgi:excinuclease UvrABC nuclease subunit